MGSPSDAPVMVQLDRLRPLRWSYGAQARLGSLPRPPEFADLTRPRKSFYALAAFLWAALVERGAFEGPEDLAECLTPATMPGALKALADAITQANPKTDDAEKKS